jgi:hypothetical protein
MGYIRSRTIICLLGLVIALTLAVQPVMAVSGTMSIAYRGSGGNYIGDTIIFDGINTFSNTTLLKITGPGLPAEGLPIYDLNGKIGSGNTVQVKPDGTWKLSWYTGTIKGIEKLQTARYYITAFDLTYPDKEHVTSLLLKKPEFYVIATPNTASYGDYVQLTGIAERGTSNVHFDITDASGKTAHSYDSSVSASGYFNKGFHIDMPDGVYTITMTTPSAKTTYRNYLTVVPSGSLAPVTTTPVVQPTIIPPAETTPSAPSVPVTPAQSGSGKGSLSVSSTPAGATVYLDSVPMGPTPLELNTVTAGNHLVEIKAPGYLTFSLQVSIKEGEALAISPVLLKSPSPMPLSLITVIAGLLISFAVVITLSKRRRM